MPVSVTDRRKVVENAKVVAAQVLSDAHHKRYETGISPAEADAFALVQKLAGVVMTLAEALERDL